jgi:UDP-GlcNAc:undecaprenyl-phosphate GlcNAc-1-phosphate transferase
VVLLGVPIFDTLFVMGVRALRGLPIMQGSPDHFAVRMRNHGIPAGRIAVSGYIASAALGVAALALTLSPLPVAATILVGVALLGASATLWLWRLGRSPDDPPGAHRSRWPRRARARRRFD